MDGMIGKIGISTDDAIEFLNSLLMLDREAISFLCTNKVSCGLSLLEHPTVQVTSWAGGGGSVGLLGILNGIFGLPGQAGPIVAVYEGDDHISRIGCFKRNEGESKPISAPHAAAIAQEAGGERAPWERTIYDEERILKDLTGFINAHSLENTSGTSDRTLALFLPQGLREHMPAEGFG